MKTRDERLPAPVNSSSAETGSKTFLETLKDADKAAVRGLGSEDGSCLIDRHGEIQEL
jgi:hypothetical protein